MLHFTVRTSREFRIRMTLAVWLITLAAWVLGAGVQVEMEEPEMQR